MRAVEVAKRAGITYRMLDWWVRNGYLRPAAASAEGVPALHGDDVRAIRAAHAMGASISALADTWHVSTATIDDAVTGRGAYGTRRVGVVGAARASTPGSGWSRHFTKDECLVAERMGRLVAAGVTPATAEKVARRPGELHIVQPGVYLLVADLDLAEVAS